MITKSVELEADSIILDIEDSMSASEKAKWSQPRKEVAILLHGVGLDEWKRLKEYGKRWTAEAVFSAFKRVLGETLMARRFLSQNVEIALKVVLYTRFMSSRRKEDKGGGRTGWS